MTCFDTASCFWIRHGFCAVWILFFQHKAIDPACRCYRRWNEAIYFQKYSVFILGHCLITCFLHTLGPLSHFILPYRNPSPFQTSLYLAETAEKPNRDSSSSLLLRLFWSHSVTERIVLHYPIAQKWLILVSVSTTVNSQCKCLVVFWGLSLLSLTKRTDLVPNRSRPDVTFCMALDLQTQGLILKLCFEAEQMLWLMGVLLDCLQCLAVTVDKYTIAHKFYSWHHHCCGNLSWLEGYNILFLSYHCLPVRQHSHL